MRTAKRQLTTVMSVVIGLGLMYSQLCGVLCDISGCSSSVRTNFAAASTGKEVDAGQTECGHHKQTKPKGSEGAGHRAKGVALIPSENSGHTHGSGCLHSHDQIGLLSKGGNSKVSSSQQPHPTIAIVSSSVEFSFTEPSGETTSRAPDRSPPRRVVSVLRI